VVATLYQPLGGAWRRTATNFLCVSNTLLSVSSEGIWLKHARGISLKPNSKPS